MWAEYLDRTGAQQLTSRATRPLLDYPGRTGITPPMGQQQEISEV